MSTQIQILNEKDKESIEKMKRRMIFQAFLPIAIFALSIYLIETKNNTKFDLSINELWSHPEYIFMIILSAFFLFFSIQFRLALNQDIVEGKKEILVGPIKKYKKGNKDTKCYFLIEGSEIKVTKEIYAQYNEDEILQIELAYKSKHVLNVQKGV